MQLEKWLEIWLEQYAKYKIKTKTYYLYQNMIRLHINPMLGLYELTDINTEILQNFVSQKINHGNLLNGNPLSTNTILSIVSILKQAFNYAIKLDFIKVNYFSNISIPRFLEKNIKSLTLEEQKKRSLLLKLQKSKSFWNHTLFVYRNSNWRIISLKMGRY